MGADWELLQAQGIKRTGNRGVGSPFAFVIVGVDISVDELLAKFEGDEVAQTIIRTGAADTARLADKIPSWFVKNLSTGKPPPILVYQLIEQRGKKRVSWPVVFDGRSRLAVLRHYVREGEASGDASKDRKIEAEFLHYTKSDPGAAAVWALRKKERANMHIAESLAVKAERAADFERDGVALEAIPDEIGIDGGVDPVKTVKKLLKWAAIFPDLCDEARERANDGRLKMGGAIKLSKMAKADQKAALVNRSVHAKEGPRPPSSRLLSKFVAEADGKVPPGYLALIRLATGDRSAAKDLPDAVRAAWIRAVEDAARKPRAISK